MTVALDMKSKAWGSEVAGQGLRRPWPREGALLSWFFPGISPFQIPAGTKVAERGGGVPPHLCPWLHPKGCLQ